MSSSTSLLGFVAAALVILLIRGPGVLYILAATGVEATAPRAGGLRHWLGGSVARNPWPRYASGVLYLGLGVSTALAGRRSYAVARAPRPRRLACQPKADCQFWQ